MGNNQDISNQYGEEVEGQDITKQSLKDIMNIPADILNNNQVISNQYGEEEGGQDIIIKPQLKDIEDKKRDFHEIVSSTTQKDIDASCEYNERDKKKSRCQYHNRKAKTSKPSATI